MKIKALTILLSALLACSLLISGCGDDKKQESKPAAVTSIKIDTSTDEGKLQQKIADAVAALKTGHDSISEIQMAQSLSGDSTNVNVTVDLAHIDDPKIMLQECMELTKTIAKAAYTSGSPYKIANVTTICRTSLTDTRNGKESMDKVYSYTLPAEIVKGWNWDNIKAINLANVQGKGIFVHPVLRKK